MKTTRTTSRYRSNAVREESRLTVALAWTVAIVFLVLLAFASWVGSFYIFGHPEEPFSYRVLKALNKIEPSQRFELTKAPRGEFLSPQAMLERYGKMSNAELEELNAILLRNFLRNYQKTKEQVPYLVGNFTILDTFPLGPEDLVESGVVALGRANAEPRVLVEHLFPAPSKEVGNLERMLLTGLDLNLQRRLDLSAVIHVERLADGRMKLTAVPLLYGTYTSTQGPGTFSLEPPQELNLVAGLPVIRSARVQAATEKYAAYRRRAGLPEEEAILPDETSTASARLLRIQRPEAVGGTPPPVVEEPIPAALAVATPPGVPVGSPGEALRVMPALPVEDAAPASGLPPAAEPVSTPPAVAEIPRALPVGTPTPFPPPPSPTPSPAAVANIQGRQWQTFEPGKMPRGRIVPLGEVPELATRGIAGERLYLQGNFVVTASGGGRAVLRSQSAVRNPFGGRAAEIRIIADFPEGVSSPEKDSTFSRDASRPFQIIDVTREEDGQINVRVREITR